jgi:hypothetical protein
MIRRVGLGVLIAAVMALLAAPTGAGAAVLYDQTANPSGGGHGSNEYNSPNEGWDDQIADDFTVPPGQSWQISHVDVLGSVGSSPTPPSSVNVFLYANAGTLPGTELFHETGIAATGQPNYSIPLIGAPDLAPGTYWVSVQQVGAELASGSWSWSETSTVSGNPAAWRNPGGSASTSCSDWGTLAACLSLVSNPDELFKLSGTAAPFPPPPGPIPASGQRAAALASCKKRAKKHNWSKKRLKKCKRKANLLPV